MKKYTLKSFSIKRALLALLLIAVFLPFNIYAQSVGWRWVRYNTGGGNDAWPVATDPSGNVFVSGLTFGSSPNVFSGHTIPQIGLAGGYQAVMVKYILWVTIYGA